MLINWEVFGMNVNKSARHVCKPPIAIYRCGLHKLLILTAGCSHFVSIKQRKAATDQIISTCSWITPLLLLGKCCAAQRVPRRTKKRWRRPLFLTICSKTRACLTHRLCGVRLHPWCSWHVARDTQKDRERERWLTRGPSILLATMGVHSVRLVSLMCVTLAWRVMEGVLAGGGWVRVGGAVWWWGVLHILDEEKRRKSLCTYGVNIVSEMK